MILHGMEDEKDTQNELLASTHKRRVSELQSVILPKLFIGMYHVRAQRHGVRST
jgi:hypothetical protein